jgi:hypothetical protein
MIEPDAPTANAESGVPTSWPLPPRERRLSGGAAATRAATRKGTAATRKGAAVTLSATRRGAAASRHAARAASDFARERGARVTVTSREAAAQLMTEHGDELRGSLWRLRKVRTPQGALQALESELEHLLAVAAPTLVEHPLPVRRASSARVIVGGTAAAVALGEGLDEVAALFSAGTTIAPSLPVLVAAAFLSVAVETAVATSLRVHDLRAAGIEVSPDAVSRDVIFAMAGGRGAARGAITRQLLNKVAARVLSRWGAGLVPVLGAVYCAWDAQQTIGAIRRLPTPSHTGAAPVVVRSRATTVLPPAAPA